MTHGTLQQPAANVASTSAVPSNNERKVPLVTNATFVCAGGVDAQKLLRATRETLLARAQKIGGNVLVDERYVHICSGYLSYMWTVSLIVFL
jgi:hypothetical protein